MIGSDEETIPVRGENPSGDVVPDTGQTAPQGGVPEFHPHGACSGGISNPHFFVQEVVVLGDTTGALFCSSEQASAGVSQ